MRSIFGLFAKSPFGPLVQHAERVHDTVVLIRPMFDAFVAGDWEQTEEMYNRIEVLEHEADVIKNDIRDHLPKSLFLPVDRGDLLTFLKEQDRIADRAEDLGVLLTMRRTPTPDSIKEDVLRLVDAVVTASEKWYQVARELPTLLEASFTGPEVDRILGLVNEVALAERETDDRQALVTKRLFEHEDEIGAVSVMMWFNIVRVLGSMANAAENTADLLRLMLAKR